MWYKLVLLFVEKFRQTVQPVIDFEDEKMNNKIDLGCCIIVFWFYCAVVVSQLRNEILVFSLPHQLEKLLIFAQLLQLVIFIFLEINRMNISKPTFHSDLFRKLLPRKNSLLCYEKS